MLTKSIRRIFCTQIRSTQLIHNLKINSSNNAIIQPIYKTSSYYFESCFQGQQLFSDLHKNDVFVYSRMNHPNVQNLENKIAILDYTNDAIVFSSGMNAITTTLLSFVKPGDHILYTTPIYSATHLFCKEWLAQFSIHSTPIHYSDTNKDIRNKIQHNTKIIFIETPSNPLLKLTSIQSISYIAKKKNILVIVDNTMMGPLFLSPFRLGADIVIQSLTKSINGHSDVLAGSVSGQKDIIDIIRKNRTLMGGILDPDSCWLVNRSLATYPIRMKKQIETTLMVVEYIRKHPLVRSVYYPTLASGKERDIYNTEYMGSGNVFSFELNDNCIESIFKRIDKCKTMKISVSLGSVETLIQHPWTMTHAGISEEEKLNQGIKPSLVRVSIGLEDIDDIIYDFDIMLK